MSIAYVQFANLALGHVIDCMQPVTETRLIRLQMLVKKHNDSLADLNEAIGLVRTDATLSQIRTKAPHSKTGKPRVMGDDLARKIEERLSLDCGWMDTPPSHAELHGEDDPRTQVMKIMENMSAEESYRAFAVVAALKSTTNTTTAPVPATGSAKQAPEDADTDPKRLFTPIKPILNVNVKARGRGVGGYIKRNYVFETDQNKEERRLVAAMAGAKIRASKTQRKG